MNIAPPPLWALIGIALIGIAAAVRFITPILVAWFDRTRRRIPKHLHDELVALLSNRAVIDRYAPASAYMSDLDEGERRPAYKAWLSPYARAVRASVKRQPKVPKGQQFHARHQIREASRRVTIRPLTEEESKTIGGTPDPNDTYAIELLYDGHNPADIERLFPAIRSQLGLRVLERTPDDNPSAVTLIASRQPLRDSLETMSAGVEFFTEHPATSPKGLPMAFTSDGVTWSLPTHHTLIFGVTGSGKSGPLLASIYQLSPFIADGSVKIFGIDPRHADVAQFSATDLFERVVTSTEDSIDLINEFHERMEKNIKRGLTSVEPSPSTPWHILIVDEVFALYNALKLRGKPGMSAWTNLQNVLAMGRGCGFFVIMATQFAEQENLKGLRANLVNKIVLRQESAYLNDFILGDGAAENGYDSTALRPATADNGYATAGIGFVKGEAGAPMKVKFAYLSKSDLHEFIAAHTHEEHDVLADLEDLTYRDLDDLDALPDLD
ncbi:hypothetical protein LG274_12080 [Micrococcus antarcticus]|uniref:type IV secretory system conjugative DNA transfer family protein n=1 Tax=Micrococcus antarcticus TaxID=86171 RepID=UPI003851542D